MNDQQIQEDRQKRVSQAKGEIEAILRKYDLDITAEDRIGESTMLKVKVQFVDTKKYDAPLAQPDRPIVEDLLDSKGDEIPKKK